MSEKKLNFLTFLGTSKKGKSDILFSYKNFNFDKHTEAVQTL